MIASRTAALRLLPLSLALFCALVSAEEFYVAPNGNNDNPGTSASAPWRTIAKANSSLEPGDVVYLRGGKYVDDPIRPQRSGTDGQEIRYTAYDGEKPVLTSDKINGLDPAVDLSNRSYITVEGIEVDGVRPNPDSRVKHFVALYNASYNKIIGSTFRYAHGWYGIRFADGAHHNELVDNVVHFVGLYEDDTGNDWGDSIQIRSDSHHNLIEGNTITKGAHNLLQVEGQFNVVRNNVFDNDWSDAVGDGKGGRNLSLMGRRNLFEGNIVRHAGSSADSPYNAGMKTEGRNNIVRRNFIYVNNGEGITTQSRSGQKWAHENRIFHNTFYANGGPAWTAIFYDGGNGVTGNVLKNNVLFSNRRDSGLVEADILFKLKTNPMGVVGQSVIEHNLIAGDSDGDARVEIKGGGGLMSLDQAESRYKDFLRNNIQARATFISGSPEAPDDFALAPGSRGIDEGAPLTFTANEGSGKVIALRDAGYFTAGFSLIEGDRIRIGDGEPLRLVHVDYSSHEVTLAKSAQWDKDAPVHLDYRGSGPDIGAHEAGAAEDEVETVRPGPPSGLRGKSR